MNSFSIGRMLIITLVIVSCIVIPDLNTGVLDESNQAEQKVKRESMYEKYLNFSSYVRGGTVVPNWMADGARFWYVDGDPDSLIVWKINPAKQRRTELFDIPRLRNKLAELLEENLPGRGVPFRTFSFEENEQSVRFHVNDREVLLQLSTYEVSFVPRVVVDTGDFQPQPFGQCEASLMPIIEVPTHDGRRFATIRDYNLWIRSPAENDYIQLTTDGEQDYEWGLVLPGIFEWVHWSPDDSHIAVRKSDYRDIPQIPVIDWLKSTGVVNWVRPQFTSHAIIELYIIDVETKEPVRVDIPSGPGLKMHVFGWLPDGSELIFATLDRAWRHLELLAADPVTGKTRLLLVESNDTFVYDWWFLYLSWWEEMNPFTLLDSGDTFIWRSERSGWWQLYLYDIDGTKIRALTDHAFPVTQIESINEESGWIYYLAQPDTERPYDRHLFRVNLRGGQPEQLTEGKGLQQLSLGPSGEYFVATYSTVSSHPVTKLHRISGTELMTLAEADISALKEIGWHPPEEFTVKAADGETDLYGVIYKPHDFDPTREYPVIESNYAYPLSTAVPRTFIAGLWEPALAQIGYIVVMLDARGTPWRGKAFMDAIYGNMGRVELEDHVAALRQLAEKRPYMDMSRVGITGGSGGAWFAIRALLKAPEVYHVGVARAPNEFYIDLRDDDVNPYMGLPEENQEAYEFAGNMQFVDRLEGHLLITIGTADVNTPFGISMILMDAFIKAGKQVDMLVLPGEAHGPGEQARQYQRKAILRYFDRHLKP